MSWINLKNVILYKRSQTKEYILYNFTYVKYIVYDFIYMIEKAKSDVTTVVTYEIWILNERDIREHWKDHTSLLGWFLNGCMNVMWKSLSHVQFFATSQTSSLPGSSVPGIFQARTLEWVAIPFSRGSSWPRDRTQVSHIAGGFFTIWATREAQMVVYICPNPQDLNFYLY